MDFLESKERAFLTTFSSLSHCNPFLPERVELERRVLGSDFVQGDGVWNLQVENPESPDPNPMRITSRMEPFVQMLRDRLDRGAIAEEADLNLYEDVVFWLLFHRYQEDFGDMVKSLDQRSSRRKVQFYERFLRDWKYFFHTPGFALPTRDEAAHYFSCAYQVRRAFHYTFRFIIGSSFQAARLRAMVWQSIFTYDLPRYMRSLYQHLGEFVTLITGPSGTGKELVARAVGLSFYMPFDPQSLTFPEDLHECFHALNLSAMPSTLIESELFGHCRGAFTGAVQDRQGWLELCHPLGTVFLDEIGDLEATLQVKLLRVLQERTFQRLGETTNRKFQGKLVAATNRDLAEAMETGHFREDFYYRLCSNVITTPSLHDQMRESSDTLQDLLLFIAQRIVGEGEAEWLAGEAYQWIIEHLGEDYPWPGNIRELEQCVRNILISKEYHPIRARNASVREELVQPFLTGTLTADTLLKRYCTLVYAQTNNYEETARRLDVDWRTVKKKIDPSLLEMLQVRQ